MDFNKAGQIINTALRNKQPDLFSSSWIFYNAPQAYHYASRNLKTPLGDIDWIFKNRLKDGKTSGSCLRKPEGVRQAVA